MSATQAVLMVAVFGASAVVSAVAGFGFGLMSVPLATLILDVRTAVVLSTLLGTVMTVYQTALFGRHALRPIVLRTCLAAYSGMPLGYWLYVTVPAHWLKLALGTAILIAVGLLLRRIDLRHAGPGLDVACGFISGVLNTSLSTNGPPLVFGLQARRLDAHRFRGTISVIFALCNIASVTIFAAKGKLTSTGVTYAAMAIPAMLVGMYVGGRVRGHVDEVRFRRLVLILLTGAGIAAIATA